jgi:methionyl aminopeptidase
MLKSFFRNQSAELKSAREVGLMREAGKVVAEALRLCRSMAQPGVRTLDIDRAVEALFARRGVTPLLKVDTACKLDGWCADAAITIGIGELRPECQRLIQTAEQVLAIAILEMGRCHKWSEVALRMQQFVERAGYSVVQQYVGHGIGRIMHEHPQVPNFFSRDIKKHDFRLEEGLVLAVEPMVNMGRPEVDTLRDHWTVVTRDGLPSAHVEHTLAMTREGVKILTEDETVPRVADPGIPATDRHG